MNNPIEDFIVRHIADKHGITTDEIRRDADLFDNGYVDSLGVFNMMLSLEAEFGIRFIEDDLINPNINTVCGLAAIIAGKRGH
ncbi:MAG: acyl carrier protein [Chromatiaceae bacterium]|nr:acyl carrier protein [Chromatiaceae bacterium]